MSKRRTKNQKQAAQNHYQLGKWYSEPNKLGKTEPQNPLQSNITALALYGYEPNLINLDLRRTAKVVMVILVIELLMYRFWI